uniref:Uncharacterized protein n=1 Tax=Anguilla anguilla TaxID=7936 RepID=A0A0E9TLZ1_ANGAN
MEECAVWCSSTVSDARYDCN